MNEAEVKQTLDQLLARAEQNGWNGAINAARTILPTEYSLMLRPLYKRDSAAISSPNQTK